MKSINLKNIKEFVEQKSKKDELQKELFKINQFLGKNDIQNARKTLDNLIIHIDYLFDGK